jgi:hypothetical protein
MASSKNSKVISSEKSNFNRHKSHCKICAHPQREEIERAYIDWVSPAQIAAEFKLRDRSCIYRHAHALNLVPLRDRNSRALLHRYLERADEAPVTAGGVMQAITLLARINARGELVELDEQVGSHDFLDQMNPYEREAYAKDGTLPSWCPRSKDTKGPQGSGGNENA